MRIFREKCEQGFSMTELLVSIAVLIPIMGAAIALFSVGAEHRTFGQRSIDASQDARTALQIMVTEIAQAGSHADAETTTSSITGAVAEQTVTVASTAGFNVGDYVDVDVPPNDEIVQITGITSNGLTGAFRRDHPGNPVPIRLAATPYATGVIAPADMGPNESRTVMPLRFFGHIQGVNGDDARNDLTLHYVEYDYDAAENRILRSMTPLTQGGKNNPLPFINNISAAQFTLNTDDRGIVTSVVIGITVRNTIKNQVQQTPLSCRVSIPSAIAGSALLHEYRQHRGLYPPLSTPDLVMTWAGLE